jgi:2-C-methyl-D-erythritol 4-phosphate cytidylyltransferase
MHVTAILLAGGKGERLKSRIDKPLVKLGGAAVIKYSLELLNRHALVKDIILVVSRSNKDELISFVKASGSRKVSAFVVGGARRQDSVFNALNKLSSEADLVLVHDSCRPFVSGDQVSALITRARKAGAAILGVPVKATIKEVTCRNAGRQAATRIFVKRTLERRKLFEVQTPQVFRRELIVNAYKKFNKHDATDDAALIERSGKPVELVCGSYENIKITTPEDLIIAGAILKSRRAKILWKE